MKEEKPPDIRYPMHAPCGMGYRGEFRGAASMSPAARAQKNNRAFNLADFINASPFHELSHDILFHAANLFPRTAEMERIVFGPEYQGDMQMECLVLACQFTLINLSLRNEPFDQGPVQDLENIKKAFIETAINNSKSKALKDPGNKGRLGAFYIGSNASPPRTMFDVRRQYNFNDDVIHAAASALAKEKGDTDWKTRIKDGDIYDLPGNLRETYITVKTIDPKDETFQIMADRIAHFIFGIQNYIRVQQTEVAALRGFENWAIQDFMRGSPTVSPEQSPHFKEEYVL